MAVALLADIHGNLEAFEACLNHVRATGIERLVFLGDYVGYGADAEAVTRRIIVEVEAGAIAVAGNHDAAIADTRIEMNETARLAIAWTRQQLSEPSRQFLAALPLTVSEDSRLYVHADPAAPADWNYILDSNDARRAFAASKFQFTFCGHVHEPAIYCLSMTGKVTCFVPISDIAVPLMPQRRWLVVMGSVGQPRDGNPAAFMAILDEVRNEITFRRVPYDVERAAGKILGAGLPRSLAERLKHGR